MGIINEVESSDFEKFNYYLNYRVLENFPLFLV